MLTTTHAAIVYAHDPTGAGLEHLVSQLAQEGVAPDQIEQHRTELLSIDRARELGRTASTRQAADRDVYVCFGAERLVHEAQHAMLKTLEEPAAGVHIYVCLPPGTPILDTIRSRVQVVDLGGVTDQRITDSVAEFIAMTPAARLDWIDDQMKNDKDEWLKGVFPTWFKTLVQVVHNQRQTLGLSAVHLERLLKLSQLIDQRGVNKKMILEYVALLLPGDS